MKHEQPQRENWLYTIVQGELVKIKVQRGKSIMADLGGKLVKVKVQKEKSTITAKFRKKIDIILFLNFNK